MATTIVVGDGPGGLSAALFLAKNGESVVVFGTNETAMHYAYLYNYLGIEEISGSDLQAVGRAQAASFGADLREVRVAAVRAGDGGSFTVMDESGVTTAADYLVMTEGKSPELALSLGVATDGDGNVEVDRDYRSSLDGVYVIGRSARPRRSQAIISAGAGAAAALDILSREQGKDVQDWDSPPKDDG